MGTSVRSCRELVAVLEPAREHPDHVCRRFERGFLPRLNRVRAFVVRGLLARTRHLAVGEPFEIESQSRKQFIML